MRSFTPRLIKSGLQTDQSELTLQAVGSSLPRGQLYLVVLGNRLLHSELKVPGDAALAEHAVVSDLARLGSTARGKSTGGSHLCTPSTQEFMESSTGCGIPTAQSDSSSSCDGTQSN